MIPATFGVNLANVNKQSFAQVNAITATVTALSASNIVTNSLTSGTASTTSLTASNVWSPVIAGNTATLSSLYVSGTTYSSNLQILGTFTTINSTITSSSNLVINDYGTGPALTVIQQETTSQPVATFQAGAVQALYITNTGQIGLGKTTPGYTLDVSGSASVTTLKAGSLSVSCNVWSSNVSATSINASTATITNLLTTTHINTTGHSSSNFSGTNENLSAFLNCSNVVANYVATGVLSAATVLINGVSPLTSAPVTAWSNITATNNLALSNVTASNISIRGYSNVAPFQVYNWSSNQPTLQIDKSGQVDICGNLYVSGNIGIGTFSPQAAIDANTGTIRANSFQMTNASGKKQFDSGSFTAQLNGTFVTFNFTFTNVPTVVCSVNTNPWNTGQTLATVASPYSVTTTNCYINQVYWNTLATGYGQSTAYGAWQQCYGMTVYWMAFG